MRAFGLGGARDGQVERADTVARGCARLLRALPASRCRPVAFSVSMVLGGNGLLAWLLLNGRMLPAHVVVLVAAEAVLLGLLFGAAQLGLRRAHRADATLTPGMRFGRNVFQALWIAGASSLILTSVDSRSEVLPLLDAWQPWWTSGLAWLLAFTFVLGLVHVLLDRAHYRQHRGQFQSSVGFDYGARLTTLTFGAIPYALPVLVLLFVCIQGFTLVARRLQAAPLQAVLAALALAGIVMLGFYTASRLLHAGLVEWVVNFLFAKVIAELMVACLPLIMADEAGNLPRDGKTNANRKPSARNRGSGRNRRADKA